MLNRSQPGLVGLMYSEAGGLVQAAWEGIFEGGISQRLDPSLPCSYDMSGTP
jgi:hypothetical protein